MRKTPHRRIILDMDSSESPVHGEQEGSAYNGHFGCKCYHPLFCFNQYGDCEGAMLRSGNVHSADRWKELLEPIIQRYEGRKVRKYFRGDAAFAKPEMYEYLEEKGLLYAIRLPANDVLRVGFIVTNMSARAAGVVYFYNRRGTAEQWIKGGKYALNWTRLSCKHFLSNQVRLCLFVLAYNLGNFLRRLALPGKIKHWSLRSLLVKLIKIGAKVLRHSRYVTFQMAEVAISKEIFAEILFRVNRLRNCSL